MSEDLKVLSPWRKFENIVRRALFKLNPGIGVYDSAIFGRVVSVNIGGGRVDDKNKIYSVGIQPLLNNLQDDPDWPEIVDVPIDPNSFGGSGVVYSCPVPGAIVRFGFMRSDPRYPYIISVTGEGVTLPAGEKGEFRIQDSEGSVLQIKDGAINFKTSSFNSNIEKICELISSLSSEFTTAAVTAADGGTVLKTNMAAALATWETQLKSGSL